jgi:major membrane immunogen (membrane-anchored lipoprotein)
MNNRPIRILAICAALAAPVLLAACGDSDPAPATSDQVTTSTMTDGDSMSEGKTSTTEAMTDGDSMDDGKTSTTEAMTDGDSMSEGKTSTTEAMTDGDSMSEG